MKTASDYLPDFGQVIPIKDGTGIWENYGGEWVQCPIDNSDPYLLLSTRGMLGTGSAGSLSALVLLTSGWGAPLNENGEAEGAPSEHPQRRRVHLMVVTTPDGCQASRLQFEGESEPVDDETGGASGALADALDLCAVRLWGTEFTSALLMQYATAKADGADASTLARIVERVQNIAPHVLEALEEGEGA